MSIGLIIIVGISMFGDGAGGSDDVPASLRWEPEWRRKGDCGLNSLYVLMKISGSEVAFDDVVQTIPIDPEKGCSLESLNAGANTLGFPTDVRFLKPAELGSLKCPFILHTDGSLQKGVGHFLIVVGFDAEKRQFRIIDTAYETTGNIPEKSVLKLFSGYVLLPRHQSDFVWRLMTAGVFLASAGLCWVGWIRKRKGVRRGKVSEEERCQERMALSSEK